MTTRELLQALWRTIAPGASLPVRGDARALDAPCTGVAFDSRAVVPGTVFVALRGLKADGIAFVPQAIAAGAAAVVAESERTAATSPDVPWLTVPDARLALALLAAEFHGHPSRRMRVVGVTGTNGKTTTTYLTRAILEAAGIQTGLLGTVTYRIGERDVPAVRTTPEAPEVQRLLAEMVSAGCGACAMEVSSHALALHRVDGIEFAAGVFTNLTRDHLDFHGDMDAYFNAKRRLFEILPPSSPSLINADDPRCAALVEVARRPVTYGITRTADVMPGPILYSLGGLDFEVRAPQGAIHVRSSLVGRPNVYNILAAVGTAAAMGVAARDIERGLEALSGVPGRFERVSAPDSDVTVIVDYAHTDDALRNLLETARQLAPRRLITVFGAGGDRDRTKRPLMGMVAARLSDMVIVTSDNPRSEEPERIVEEIRRGADPEARLRHIEVVSIFDRDEAIRRAITAAEQGDVVLIAGKGHEKYQEIGGTTLPFDDVAVARHALEARRVRSRVR